MATRERHLVLRADGRTINVPCRPGQLFVCSSGCCCGRTADGHAPVPTDLYHQEWERRRLRNRVHLMRSGCLGSCTLANVALLLFGGREIWFHSITDERVISAIYDYIEDVVRADSPLPPPPALAGHVFTAFDCVSIHAKATFTTPDVLAEGDFHCCLDVAREAGFAGADVPIFDGAGRPVTDGRGGAPLPVSDVCPHRSWWRR